MPLFRVQSTRRLSLPAMSGTLRNPNIDRPRRPRDISNAAHEAADQWFFDEFGVKYRSAAIFCSGSIDAVAGYLMPGFALLQIAPIGEYSLCYSKNCKDLYGHLQFQDRMNEQNIHLLAAELKLLNYVQHINSGLDDSASSGSEVMLYAESFSYKVRKY